MRSIKVQGKNLANFMLGHAYVMQIVGRIAIRSWELKSVTLENT